MGNARFYRPKFEPEEEVFVKVVKLAEFTVTCIDQGIAIGLKDDIFGEIFEKF